MANIIKNGKVVYVEPNAVNDFTAYSSTNNGEVFKSVDLEDMCIVVGLEVEIKGRTYMSSKNGGQENIELQWKSGHDGEKVSFMEGSKIPTKNGGYIKSLTTNYTDCHLVDVQNDGTAEMFGIKSIDISYDNFMVPEVTIQFIDVRGVSLFAQEEMRHNLNSTSGMTGLTNNNVEGSFFKCFFTFPYPKFTLKVKGFYGEMASYELTCSDFRASFDSNTGNFNVTAKFVGYSFSFLSDVMTNALVSAPYCTYEGKEYWENNIKNGRFKLGNGKNKEDMQKLGYICEMYKEIEQRVAKKIKDEGWEKIIEEATKDDDGNKKSVDNELKVVKNSEISGLKQMYSDIINALRTRANTIENPKNGDIAINPDGTNSYAFILDYDDDDDKDEENSLENLTKQVKKLNDLIGEKAKHFKELKEWNSQPGHNLSIIKKNDYGDIIEDNKKVKTSVVTEEKLRNAIEKKADDYIVGSEDKRTYYTAWTDDDDSTVYIYQDFEIKKLLSDDIDLEYNNEEEAVKIREKYEQILINREFLKEFKFAPSVENITKTVMAHVETFIHMITHCSDSIIGDGVARSAENLKIKYENFPDIHPNNTIGATKDTIVAPFPKVTRMVDYDGVSKMEDEWIGELIPDANKAKEILLVEGLLNGIAEVSKTINDSLTRTDIEYNPTESSAIKYPLSYFDLFLKEGDKPFGNVILSDVNSIFANACVRAFSIMVTQGQHGYETDAYAFGQLDAENFLEIYRDDADIKYLANLISTVNSDKVIDFLTKEDVKIDETKRSKPWRTWKHLISISGDDYKLRPGYLGGVHAAFPMRNWNLVKLPDKFKVNDEDPKKGVEQNNLSDYIITPLDYQETNCPIIITKDAPIVYFRNTYSRLEDSTNGGKVANGLFKLQHGFVFDYTSWVKPYNAWDLFHDKDYKKVEYINAIDYDDAGNVISTHECALDFKNIFMDISFLNESDDSRYKSFIRELFIHAGNRASGFMSDQHKIDGGNSLMNKIFKDPMMAYAGKFSVLKDAILFSENKRGKREKILNYLKSYLDTWGKNVYKNIENVYRLKLKGNTNMQKLQEALLKAERNENSINEVFKIHLADDYFEQFKRIYDPEILDSKQKTCGGINLRTKPCDEMDDVIKDLMKIVGVCLTSKFNQSREYYESDNKNNSDKDSKITLESTRLKQYFDGFIKVLQENLKGSEDGNGDDTKIELNTDPEDIKVGVYNYIKMLYDKWLASNTQGDFYRMETLFDNDNPTFHFLDSAYNNIGKSMMLNLSTLVDRIVQSQTQNGYTLLSLLSALYADNKFLFLCIQNFLDLMKDNMMDKMFKPIPYLDMVEPDNNPNFIVLMPYEPSSRLDVEGADYPDDGFYLNDESSWPEMISTKKDDGLPIPAFGVSYGQQYQNYFKNIQVDMSSPMTTEQSIKAKFMIAGASSGNQDNGPKLVTMGQDLYTIYSNNSYTCTVTMMGCAWVQPMMYFVLQNVPMFRGSYMIVKVNHQIQPGSMITTFKGVRMAKTATRSVEQIVYGITSDSVGGAGGGSGAGGNVGGVNDCDYAYYNPDGKVYDVPDNSDANAYCYATYKTLREKGGLTEAQAKGICANIWAESGFNPMSLVMDATKDRKSHGFSGGLCHFHYKGMADDLYNVTFGPEDGPRKLEELNNKVNAYWKSDKSLSQMNAEIAKDPLIKFDVTFAQQVDYLCKVVNKSPFNAIKNYKTVESATDYWLVEFENPGNTNVKRWNTHGKYVNDAITAQEKLDTDTNKPVSESTDNSNGNNQRKNVKGLALRKNDSKKDDLPYEVDEWSIYNEKCGKIGESIQKSLRANKEYSDINIQFQVYGDRYVLFWIMEENQKEKRCAALFDCTLSTYGQLFNEIRMCVIDKDAGEIGYTMIKPSTNTTNRHIISIYYWSEEEKSYTPLTIDKKSQLNESVRLILIKYFKSHNIKTADDVRTVFRSCVKASDEFINEMFELEGVKTSRKCNSVTGESNNEQGFIGEPVDFSGEVTDERMKKILHDLGRIRYLNGKKAGQWKRLQQDTGYDGHCTSGPWTWYGYAGISLKSWWWPQSHTNSTFEATRKNMNAQGFELIFHGTKEYTLSFGENGPVSGLQPCDICTLFSNTPSSHAAMWTGKDWRSDAIQRHIWIYGSSGGRNGNYAVCIWRHRDFMHNT